MQASAGNHELIALLEEFAQISEITGEAYREKAYRGAISGIKSLTWNVKSNPERVETEKIPGVGKAIRKKILEWIKTGTIAELVKLQSRKEISAYKIFIKVLGVGPATIRDWLSIGVYDLGALRKKIGSGEITLTDMQKYGLMYYGDLNERIPRDEVTHLSAYIMLIIRKVDPLIVANVCGSYRRGAEDSGDIDILVSNKNSFNPTLLRNIHAVLEKDSSFVTQISIGRERYTFLYRSLYRGNVKVRQIDILNLDYSQYWPGILYFTGSWEFNEAMRGWAKKRGFKLNQKGLFKSSYDRGDRGDKSRTRGTSGVRKGTSRPAPTQTQVISDSEEEIFAALGLKYVPPQERTDASKIEIRN